MFVCVCVAVNVTLDVTSSATVPVSRTVLVTNTVELAPEAVTVDVCAFAHRRVLELTASFWR